MAEFARRIFVFRNTDLKVNGTMLDFLGNLQRTHKCGELRAEQDVVLMGWVNRRRDHGNLIFLDVRDRTGITQVVLDKEISGEAHAKAEAAPPEDGVAGQ